MSQKAKYVTITKTNFDEEVLKHSDPVLVDFWAPWCGPCRAIAPVIEELAQAFEGRAKIAKVNVDDHPELAATYGVQGIPTMVLFRDGKAVDQIVGAVPKQVLIDKLNAAIPV